MARRSAQNPRYQKDAKVGSTRRSAASAKPKRDAGESGGSGGSGGGSSANKRPRRAEPDTPEFKRWRQIWIGLLAAGGVLAIGAYFWRDTVSGNLSLVFAYACIFSALYVDFTKIRRMRKQWVEEQNKGSKGKD